MDAEATAVAAVQLRSPVDPAAKTVTTTRIHPTAVVDESARIGEGTVIGPRVTIDEDVVIGCGVQIEAGTCIGPHCRIGDECRLGVHVTLRERTLLGARVRLESGSVLGSDGFGFAPCSKDGNKLKMPQVGNVVLGDDVHVGANTTIDRATLGSTSLGHRVWVGALVQVAHNCEIADDAVIGSLTGICGSSTICARARLGSSVGVIGHITVHEDAVVCDGAGVTRTVKPGETVSGFPAIAHERTTEIERQMEQLPELCDRLRQVEGALNGRQKKS